ncbi:MAG: MFS transporter, partial [Caulobacteraceae bacterium]|nr:MFS transporter [Caulobacter sp.]
MTACYHARCDSSHCRRASDGVAHPTLTLATSILASSLAFIDSSVTNVALPALQKSLGGGPIDLQWTINGYALPLAALLLVGGAAGDRFGRRRLLVAGIALFALASIGCAAAPSYAVLVPMRALQGVGAAFLMPNSLALLTAAFPERTRGRAIGTWAAVGVVASAAGPVIGGWLIGLYGWRAIFLINLPLAAVAIYLACRYVAEWQGRDMAVDWLGGALATLALGLFAWTLTNWSSHQAMPTAAPVELVVALAVLTAFFWIELRRGERAMMPLGMFASRAFVGLSAITFLIYAALSGLFLLLPYTLIEGGYTPLQAGLALLPFPAIVAVASRPLGQLAGRVGARWPLTFGSLGAAAGYALMTLVEPTGSYL